MLALSKRGSLGVTNRTMLLEAYKELRRESILSVTDLSFGGYAGAH